MVPQQPPATRTPSWTRAATSLANSAGGDVVDRLAVHHGRQACVGLEQDGDRGQAQVLSDHGSQRLGAQGTVNADGVRSHTLQHSHHSGGGCPRHELSVLPKGAGHQHGEVGIFFRGQQGGLGLIAVVHSLDHNEIDTVFLAQLDRLGKDRNGVLEVKIAQWLQHLARGADIQSHKFFLRSYRLRGGVTGVLHGGADNVVQLLCGELEDIRPEGIGIDHVRARVKVGAVDGHHLVGVGKIPSLGQLPGGKTCLLQKGAHAAVQGDEIIL